MKEEKKERYKGKKEKEKEIEIQRLRLLEKTTFNPVCHGPFAISDSRQEEGPSQKDKSWKRGGGGGV